MANAKGVVSIPASGGEAGLNRYLSEIKKFPILAPEEEYMLAKRWREHGDTEAAAKLVNSHLRLVAKIAMGYRGYGLPVSELISEGNIGLMQGVKKFEPDRGFRLATYAMWWIRASIQEFILRSWSLVKMGTTAAQKKLFFNLRRMKNQIDAFEEGDLKPADVTKIATDLGVTEDEVVSMNRRMAMGGDTSLNVSLKGDEGGPEADVWAVGVVGSGPMILHWDGEAWTPNTTLASTRSPTGLAVLTMTSMPLPLATARWRTGCEGRISVLKRRHGLRRCIYRGDTGMKRWVGLGVIADNLQHIGKVLAGRKN